LDCSKPQKKFRNNAVAPLNTQDESANMPFQSSLNSDREQQKETSCCHAKEKNFQAVTCSAKCQHSLYFDVIIASW